jgi:hypothetical protein
MVERSDTQFESYNCVKLANGHLILWITRFLWVACDWLVSFWGREYAGALA